MGEINVKSVVKQKDLNEFTKLLLQDVKALDRMLKDGYFEDSKPKIGAEQEICLIDEHFKPAPRVMDLLDKLDQEFFTTELAKFNIEANLTPHYFEKDCFTRLEKEILGLLHNLREEAAKIGVDFSITGILPTIRKFDLGMENLTPLKRYNVLISALNRLRGKVYELRVRGIDELLIKHESAMLEACNTSFQVHLQVNPADFVKQYNNAQVLTAPVLALASNSPMLFGRRLWRETRVALFQQSIDTRISSEHLRDRSPRVIFGTKWCEKSILDLYKEDIMRFRIMLMTGQEDDAMQCLDKGEIPRLRALTIHNSTVYRWNRPCYGIGDDGKPHLRIENRALPAGPTVIDEVANAAFWLGLMTGFSHEYKDITKLMDFDDAKSNFFAAAREGMETELSWVKGLKISVAELIKKELIPLAREGLERRQILKKDINRYLSVIEERNESRQNGSTWILNSFSKLSKEANREEISIAITAAMVSNQKKERPVHKWKLAGLHDIGDWRPTQMIVEEFMDTDLFTVHQDDIVELVADMMDWQKLRYVLVEDDRGKLTGLVSSGLLLRHFRNKEKGSTKATNVKDIMVTNPKFIGPEASIKKAMEMMKSNRIGCLPVIKNDKLVGVITEKNFRQISATLLSILINKEKDI
jgi:CBS domain-containing protein/gamma-glutamylcysteine synthetase